MAIAYLEDEFYYYHAIKWELARRDVRRYKAGGWSLVMMACLSEEELVQENVTRWKLKPEFWPSVIRMMETKKLEFELLSKAECQERVKLMLEKKIDNLNMGEFPT